MSRKQKKFFVVWMMLCAYIIAVSIGHSIYTEKQVDALEENLVELVEQIADLNESK